MSSLLRRIQRSQDHIARCPYTGRMVPAGPRLPRFNGRGSKLGVKNAKAKDLVARLAREKRNKARKTKELAQ